MGGCRCCWCRRRSGWPASAQRQRHWPSPNLGRPQWRLPSSCRILPRLRLVPETTGFHGTMTENGRTPAESAVTLGQLMLPDDANPSGYVHGGVVMKLVDTAAGIAATRHARSRCVTVEIDSMTFLAPVHIGDLLHLDAVLTWTGRTS